jgi:hypothetical protein
MRSAFEEFAGSLPSETELAGMLAAMSRIESETLAWLLLVRQGARKGDKEA